MRKLEFTLLLIVAACGGGEAEPTSLVEAYRDLGQLEDAINTARQSAVPADQVDSDGDSIPDMVEQELGTDPNNRDSDFDGLVDNYELFPDGYRRKDPLPDRDGDGRHAAVDSDEDGDRINDGELIDTDGDGVPNFLEFYGWKTPEAEVALPAGALPAGA